MWTILRSCVGIIFKILNLKFRVHVVSPMIGFLVIYENKRSVILDDARTQRLDHASIIREALCF
jgi:hypothetical protein